MVWSSQQIWKKSNWNAITEFDHSEDYASKKCQETFQNMVNSISNYFTENDVAKRFMTLFFNSGADKIVIHTTGQLVKDGYHQISSTREMY